MHPVGEYTHLREPREGRKLVQDPRPLVAPKWVQVLPLNRVIFGMSEIPQLTR